ncbi:MAG TPA: 6-carboxytetrahydropterin synthase [Steroidobacteraceae bacterium]|nr:6-carboxytetrahydropterin synthase [Steroidobacteraceae bacterium]
MSEEVRVYSVCVRDHIMIAHSLVGESFGQAQSLHGATYIVDVEFRRRQLDADGVVVDIGLAAQALREVLAPFNYRNLDQLSEFAARNTTTEFLAKAIFDRMTHAIRAGRLGAAAAEIASLRVTLHESHVAWASFEAELTVR